MINIGVVGSGGIIAKHIGHLADRTDARIVALCDVNPEMIQARQEAFFEDRQVNGYATPEEMYANEQLDAVIITTAHTQIDYKRVVSEAKLVVDTRNATKNVDAAPGKIHLL